MISVVVCMCAPGSGYRCFENILDGCFVRLLLKNVREMDDVGAIAAAEKAGVK